jgi:lipid II:glycine glycyltransferase (peptidoglycan interpeptide bridge formation enzyme)
MNYLDNIASHPLQSSAWAEFRREWGNGILETKYGIITLHHLPFTKFKIGIFEKGPTPTKKMLDDLRTIGRNNNLIFIKLEPNTAKSDSLVNLLKDQGLSAGKRFFTPTTFEIDLTPSEENLLKSFSGKTRYNIRLAQKYGVSVKEDDSNEAFNRYLELMLETTKRQNFFAHTPRYHKLMWKSLKNAGIAHLLTATYNNQIITTWILFSWKDHLYYPYGASTEDHKKVMANNLMMWEAIKFGKKLGLSKFDLWGREEGKGFTKFKEGYNPKVVEFIGTWDLVINKRLYYIFQTSDKLRWLFLRNAKKIFKNGYHKK